MVSYLVFPVLEFKTVSKKLDLIFQDINKNFSLLVKGVSNFHKNFQLCCAMTKTSSFSRHRNSPENTQKMKKLPYCYLFAVFRMSHNETSFQNLTKTTHLEHISLNVWLNFIFNVHLCLECLKAKTLVFSKIQKCWHLRSFIWKKHPKCAALRELLSTPNAFNKYLSLESNVLPERRSKQF